MSRSPVLRQRFTTALRKKARRGFSGYPIATMAFYGPNDKLATKVAVGIILAQGHEPAVLERWFSEAVDVRNKHDISEEIVRFLRHHDVKSVVSPDRIIGCPHEEGIDYPEDGVCPQCPFWANRDRWTGEVEP
jgi:hypothetical protein